MDQEDKIFIDIHTHLTHEPNNQVFHLKNILLPGELLPEKGRYSAGIHPWQLPMHTIKDMAKLLEKISSDQRVVALGECGIDRAIDTPVSLQSGVFELHLQAAELHQKPVIVHVVRSYADVLQVLKKRAFGLPLIFHDYRGNPIQTRELLKFNSYFSLGEQALIHPKIKDKLPSIPFDRLFFETDASTVSIENIYLRAASLLNISAEELVIQVFENFKKVFNDELVRQNGSFTGC
ncbi:MAG: TatD family hydrolase [Prolixibacteraceae bacterium]|nr:TatD family hydrolase [Prolixibacteraceae bacterium]